MLCLTSIFNFHDTFMHISLLNLVTFCFRSLHVCTLLLHLPDIDECSSNPCVNGICINESNQFRCFCNDGYEGTRCENLILDSCSSQPCRNGGNCIVNADSTYECQCVNGWAGTNCEEGWFVSF